LKTLKRVVEEEPKKPSAVSGRVDRDLETVCLKCLEKEPDKRYGSAEAFAEDLERWIHHKPIQARPCSTAQRMRKLIRRHGMRVGRPLAHQSPVQDYAFDGSVSLMATASGSAGARVWDLNTGEPITPTFPHYGDVCRVLLSNEGDSLVTCGEENLVRLWDLTPDNRPLEQLALTSMRASGRTVINGSLEDMGRSPKSSGE
jgi:WD40 repeat protein